ncbi:hypothetical protein SETIT_4G087900v2 [Setaria italica]|uniref:Uncharacterized protein n=1 Tax=Setaria italica TaxID=4555 RepID=A0A368QU63_SETIT|nr:hypothetical protein SETIT_4G087900v2 [Setaria italica]
MATGCVRGGGPAIGALLAGDGRFRQWIRGNGSDGRRQWRSSRCSSRPPRCTPPSTPPRPPRRIPTPRRPATAAATVPASNPSPPPPEPGLAPEGS